MLAWPVELGTPVVDGDGNPDNYRIEACDRPAIRGDRAYWWVMNDVAGPRPDDQTLPIGLEIRVMAYAFDDPGALSNTTFYDYTITYKGEVPLTDTYIGPWADIDLGGASDDHIGSDTTLNMVYTYNADDNDTDDGDRPPALGYSPTGDDGQLLGMTTALALFDNFTYRGESFLTNSSPPANSYNFLRGRSETGMPVTFGGPGIGFSEKPTRYMFPAEPGEFWSEENIDGNGTTFTDGDHRMLLSSGPFTMQLGDTQHLRFAILWSQAPEGATNPRLNAVTFLKNDVRSLLPSSTPLETTADVPTTFHLLGNYPNPFNPSTRIAFDLPEAARVAVSIYDVLGREVLALPAQSMQSGAAQSIAVEAGSLPSGVYLYRVAVEGASGRQQATGRMIVIK